MINYLILAYFVIGFLLTIVWWIDEYKEEYEYEKENGEVVESYAVLTLLFMFIFWPIKFIKNYFEGLWEP